MNPSQHRIALACVGRAGPRRFPCWVDRWYVRGRFVVSSPDAPRVRFEPGAVQGGSHRTGSRA